MDDATTGATSASRPATRGNAEKTARGDATRALILETALASFRAEGYERTTMRGVARAAGVSLGNAYYYFGSKEDLVQEFYASIQAGHRRRATGALAARGFAERLRSVLHAGLDEMAPYHGFAGEFIKIAIVPTSASSPFSPESGAARDAAIGLFRDVIDGADLRSPEALAADLPLLLWLAYLGVTLFWVHDASPGQARTRALVDTAAPMIARTVRLARLPLLKGVTTDVRALLTSLRQPGARP